MEITRPTLQGFSLKRTLILVAVTEAILAVALFVYWKAFRQDFFPYEMNSDGSVTVEGEPLLVGYGRPVSPPWTFTSVGGDTLMLNGLPFLPMRPRDDTIDLAPGDRDRLLTVKGILEEAQDAYNTADTKPEGMDRFADVLAGYLGVFVDSLSVDPETEQITVDFVDDLPPFTVTFLRTPHWVEPEGLRRKKHLDIIEEFIVWMGGNASDAVFSFGPYHTELTTESDSRRAYGAMIARLDDISASGRGLPSEDDVRYALGDEEFGRWRGLIRDYLEWRGMHVAN